ncbi:nucleotide-binding universal stress UspA family protein [Chromatocurvus halotolerans]|uniref:Nucleotide-binding universal stress UspA family protein n=2 Tax=Chromatocurvus halotolerans TaxID=1132028 RepID=A0A4R2KXC6_9GAMM|nr:nucleotide-binding universal stress UspA family protein [Chromatocurvus halotolerans]
MEETTNMIQFRKVLVAVDIDYKSGTIADTGAVAVREALTTARRDNAEVTFMHVINSPGNKQASGAPDTSTAAGKQHAAALKILGKLQADAGKDLRSQTAIRFGEHWREILHAVVEENHDLVVIGTRKRSLAGRLLFGSTGNKLLRLCPCPVWVVKDEPRPEHPTVLIAHDLTPVGEAALSIAAALKQQFDGADVKVLHVVEHPEAAHFLDSVARDERQRRLDDAKATIEAQCRSLLPEGTWDITITDGNAYARILEHLEKNPVDLLVMGTVARQGIAGLLTGNTAENVLPWANCSVIAIKPPGFTPPIEP